MPNQSDPNQNTPVNDPVIPPVIPNPIDQGTLPSMPILDESDIPPIPAGMGAPPTITDSGVPDPPTVPVGTTVTEIDQTSPTGSAAPTDLPPIVAGPKKKFGTGKIIATILGLFLLIGGVGAGTYLVQQNQDIREKAGSCAPGCGAGMVCDGDSGCIPRGTTQKQIDSGEVKPISQKDSIKENPWNDIDGDGITNPSDFSSNKGCASGSIRCGGEGLAFNFCLSESLGKSCNESAYEQGYTVPIASGGCGTDTNGDGVGDQSCGTETWFCKTSPPDGASCDGKNGGVKRNDLNANSCFCGVLQIDTPTGFKSYKNNCGCKGGDSPTEESPITEESSLVITAVCQNVKAYSPTWTLLTNTQLGQLKTGDSVNFCVTGSASSGSFDKAKFTINGAVQAETTTVRPGSTDFCQLYNIPVGATTFNVTAQIHHVTLGWR